MRLTEPLRSASWWREGVFYQVYPRSFADSDGDGVGDLRGVVDRLDYLEWLGVDGVWLNPVTPSPDRDFGYDVSDYTDVHPALGTLADVDELVSEAGARGIRVLFDIVPNHTSDRHPWFLDSRSSRDSRHRDWYVWADPKPDGSPPNNWMSVFGGSAWTLDERTGQYYLHNFLAEQPDLNWWNEEVRDAFDEILRFWFDRGIAGFRIDVAHAIVKDRELRDNLPLGEDDPPELTRFEQNRTYNMNRPEVHDVHRRWRALCDTYDPPRILLGETYVLNLELMAAYYGSGDDELNLAFNFPFVHARFAADSLRSVVEATETVLPPVAWPVWTGSNHDVVRFPTRWAGGDKRKVRLALTALLTLRGTPVLYYGDELGLEEVDVPPQRRLDRDPGGLQNSSRSRDGARTPMLWSAEDGRGFTDPGVEPWLPFGDGTSVEEQRADRGSVLELTRALVALRRDLADLRRGAYRTLTAPDGVWAWERGERVTVALNLSDDVARVDGVEGVVRLTTDRSGEGERVHGAVELAPWRGVVIARP